MKRKKWIAFIALFLAALMALGTMGGFLVLLF